MMTLFVPTHLQIKTIKSADCLKTLYAPYKIICLTELEIYAFFLSIISTRGIVQMHLQN